MDGTEIENEAAEHIGEQTPVTHDCVYRDTLLEIGWFDDELFVMTLRFTEAQFQLFQQAGIEFGNGRTPEEFVADICEELLDG